MNVDEPFPPLLAKKGRYWKRYAADSVLALVSTALLTGCLSFFHLYQIIPNSLLLYLPLILALAGIRGSYAALLASFFAFFLFDFLYVPPVYSFIITKFADVIALVVFLIVAITTGQLASALRRRAQDANRREQETRVLYDVVHATNREEDMDRQLSIFAHSVGKVFSAWGIRGCAVLLLDENGELIPRTSMGHADAPEPLSVNEQEAISQVFRHAETVDVLPVMEPDSVEAQRLPHALRHELQTKQYTRLVPLKTGQRVVGVLRLVVVNDERHRSRKEEPDMAQSVFFSTFLEQAVTVIERGRLQRESISNKVLQQTDALRAALLSSVSHDLRTPLTTIKSAASSLLQTEVQLDEDVRNHFALAIERESDRLNRLVENLLDMSRIEGGALHPKKVWYLLDEIIYNVLGRMQPLLEERTVQKLIPEYLPPVEMDYVQIGQVVTNLLENAIRYTPAGSPITICIEVHQAELQVSVADRGAGVPPAERERIFDKFYRVHREPRAADADRGSGLGLAVSKGVIEAHNGRIWVEERVGGGAVFCFTLPMGGIEGEREDDERESTHSSH